MTDLLTKTIDLDYCGGILYFLICENVKLTVLIILVRQLLQQQLVMVTATKRAGVMVAVMLILILWMTGHILLMAHISTH